MYFDFDNFKPFNDTYGFRTGDRAIVLFADLLRKLLPSHSCFIGHIGGDDFFAGLQASDPEEVQQRISALLDQFKHEAQSLYDADTRARGYIEANNRYGESVRFPLLTCSAARLWIPASATHFTLEDISQRIAQLKKAAKASPLGQAEARLDTEHMPRI